MMGLFDKLPFIALSVWEWLVRFSPTCSPVTVSAWVRMLWNPSAPPRNRVETPQMRAPTMEEGEMPAIGWRCQLQSIKGEVLICHLVHSERERESEMWLNWWWGKGVLWVITIKMFSLGVWEPILKANETLRYQDDTSWLFKFLWQLIRHKSST